MRETREGRGGKIGRIVRLLDPCRSTCTTLSYQNSLSLCQFPSFDKRYQDYFESNREQLQRSGRHPRASISIFQTSIPSVETFRNVFQGNENLIEDARTEITSRDFIIIIIIHSSGKFEKIRRKGSITRGGMTRAILRGNKSRDERSRNRGGTAPSVRSNILNRITSTRVASSPASCSLSVRGRLPLARVHRLFRLENRLHLLPKIARRITREDIARSRWETVAKETWIVHAGDIQVGNQSENSCCVHCSMARVSIRFARIDFDWYSRRLRASTPSVINHCETRQGNALSPSRPVRTF